MSGRGDIGRRRRREIVEAAVAIIAERGLQHLSLSAIEERTGMSRGQLTYHFRAKEDILVAVFDHMLETMHARSRAEGPPGCTPDIEGRERILAFLTCMITQPPDVPEFHALQYTFLSQVGHREDYRERLAGLYESWRGYMTADFARSEPAVSPRTLATFVQAVLHGLAIQRAADPDSYDKAEMLQLVLSLLRPFLERPSPKEGET